MTKPTLEEAIKMIEEGPEGFAKEIFRMHPQMFIDLIPDNLEEISKQIKKDRKSQKHKKRKEKNLTK